ncbi:MAG: branched-chain amino acid ABC transporter ATP-binding protein/permease [Clostridia bacterium]|nr:branched-chain amino acid ABC transporter ATP-binding protein/permease [Clostridia bacterium]
MRKNRRATTFVNFIAVAVIFVLLKVVLSMLGGNRSVENLLTQICYNIIMVASLNLVTGVLGELTLGHAGFMSVGAYTAAIFTSLVLPGQAWAFPIALLAGGLVAAVFGYLIGMPALRLRGDYLAIITLGFGEIIRVLINTVFAPWTGGGKKMFNISLYTTFENSYWIMAITVALLFMLAWSRQGRAILSIRENEVAADASGVPVTSYKVRTFAISAFFAGIAGGLYAHSVGVLDPARFDFNTSIDYLVMVVFGGMGSYTGSIVSATGLTSVQFAMARLVEFRQLAYALLLIVMMIFKPSGLLGVKEFSLSKTLGKLFKGWQGLISRLENRLTFRLVGAVDPDVPKYYYDKNKYPVVELENIGIRFGGLTAAEGINISLDDGEIVGMIGPNGAGKTTVFNMLTGVYTPTEGDIRLMGKSIKGKPPYKITYEGVSRTFQNIRLFKSMTVLENIEVAFQSRMYYTMLDAVLRDTYYDREERGCDNRARTLLRIFEMEQYADHNASSLPYGQQRKLEICRAMASNPKLLLLDEPAAGMNPIETQELMATIKKIRDLFGVTILLIEHDMKLVMGICERIYVLNYGKIIAQGTPDEIKNNPEVIEAYLGASEKEGA